MNREPETVRYRILDTALGPAAVAGGREGLRAVLLPGGGRGALEREILRRFPGAVEDPLCLAAASRAVTGYFRTGRLAASAVRLDLSGTKGLRAEVYAALRKVPAGETVTYAELARRIGRPGACRSVGTALARNPLPVFVPCHRVLRTDGGLGGFTAEGGIDLKRAMLRLEGVEV
jgi:methylated-DNA-[protein]-cysteine S-methyltransferase